MADGFTDSIRRSGRLWGGLWRHYHRTKLKNECVTLCDSARHDQTCVSRVSQGTQCPINLTDSVTSTVFVGARPRFPKPQVGSSSLSGDAKRIGAQASGKLVYWQPKHEFTHVADWRRAMREDGVVVATQRKGFSPASPRLLTQRAMFLIAREVRQQLH